MHVCISTHKIFLLFPAIYSHNITFKKDALQNPPPCGLILLKFPPGVYICTQHWHEIFSDFIDSWVILLDESLPGGFTTSPHDVLIHALCLLFFCHGLFIPGFLLNTAEALAPSLSTHILEQGKQSWNVQESVGYSL